MMEATVQNRAPAPMREIGQRNNFGATQVADKEVDDMDDKAF